MITSAISSPWWVPFILFIPIKTLWLWRSLPTKWAQIAQIAYPFGEVQRSKLIWILDLASANTFWISSSVLLNSSFTHVRTVLFPIRYLSIDSETVTNITLKSLLLTVVNRSYHFIIQCKRWYLKRLIFISVIRFIYPDRGVKELSEVTSLVISELSSLLSNI